MKSSISTITKLSFCLIFAVAIAKMAKAQDVSPVVINAGVGGNNTKDLLKRIDKDCLSHHPDLTVLMVGTNDMNSMKHVPLAQYKINLEKIIDLIKKSKSKVLLMNVLPMYEPYLLVRHPASHYQPEGPLIRRKMVNEVIQQVAKHKKVEFLDISHVFESVGNVGLEESSYIRNMANMNIADGVHPTPDGYRSIAIAVYETIMNRKLPHNKVVCFGDSITAGDGGTEKKSYPAGLKKLMLNQ